MKRWFAILGMCLFTLSTVAQSNFSAYAWVEGDLALQIPTNWQTATVQLPSGDMQLTVAQAFADDDLNRPLAIPFVKITRIYNQSGSDLSLLLSEQVAGLDTQIANLFISTLVGQGGFAVDAVSPDGTLYALGRATLLPDNTIVTIIGRATTEQQANFEVIFNIIADSLVVGSGTTSSARQYGVLWSTLTTNAQSTTVLANVRGMTYANERLFLVDAVLGIVEIDASNGDIVTVIPFAQPTQPTSIAVREDRMIYIGDTLCRCVQGYRDGVWESSAQLSENAPQSLVLGLNSALYVTDFFPVSETETLDIVSILTEGIENQLSLELSSGISPLLTIDAAGRLLAVSRTNYGVSVADEFGFSQLYTLDTAPITINAISVNVASQLLVATQEAGVLIFGNDGKQIGVVGTAVSEAPQDGEFLHPQAIVTTSDGRVFIADNDGEFGRITAMSLGVESGRTGANNLVNGVVVEGALDASTTQQSWTFTAQEGDVITLNAVNPLVANEFDVALRLIAPDGDEVAYNDNQETGTLPLISDAQLINIALDEAGDYRVIVERVTGGGTYRLGLSQSQAITLNVGETIFTGNLSDVVQTQRWLFEGTVNAPLSITVLTENGTLDPAVRVFDSRENMLAENDDAFDASLGRNAQLIDFILPNNGTFTIEVARVGGEGQYRLIVKQ